jgi:hypothetical protein
MSILKNLENKQKKTLFDYFIIYLIAMGLGFNVLILIGFIMYIILMIWPYKP